MFGTSYTDAILACADDISMWEVKKVVREADRVSESGKVCRESISDS